MCSIDVEPAGPDGVAEVHDAAAPIVAGEPVEVSAGVYVIPDRRVPLVPNVGIVVGQRAALVVDTGIGPRNGAYVLEQARELAKDRPLFLTTTHFHPEHGFGAQAFKGAATIVYNTAQRDELHRKGQAYLGMFKGLSPVFAAELDDVELVDPDVVYHGSAEIDLGGTRVTLRSIGPAHSAGDQMILVDDRVLFTGDLVEHRMFPLAPYFPPFDVDSEVTRWVGLLDELLSLNAEVVVPGHGEIAEDTIVAYRDYFDYVRAETTRLHKAGASAEEAAEAIVLGARDRWSDWDNPDWIPFVANAFYRTIEAA
jgi:glyoxylase-like metal-dependent hydrolase (beta-lactamase superfamily II)